MKSLATQLSDHLAAHLDVLRIRDNQYAIDIEGGRIEPGALNVTTQGFHAADYHYTAVLTIERLPAASLQLLLLLVLLWLTEHDTLRDRYRLPWPSVDVMDAGDHMQDVVLEIAMVDPFYLGEDPAGPLEIDGTRYAVDAFELVAATGGDVQGGTL